MNNEKSLQETYSPNGICFGCGVKNEKGLRIRSFANGEEVTAEWHSEPHHQAFPGMLSGGIVGTLLDCHSNWTAAHFLMKQNGLLDVFTKLEASRKKLAAMNLLCQVELNFCPKSCGSPPIRIGY